MEAPPPTCTISFSGAQRAWYDGSNLLGIKVLVDGSVVSTITPSDGNTFMSETTASFNVSAGSHTITLEGYDPENIDITAFVDNVQINDAGGTTATPPVLANAGFEMPVVGVGMYADYQYTPALAAQGTIYAETYTYDALGEQSTYTDRNGTVHAYSYDSLGRLTADNITSFASGVDQTVSKIGYAYNDTGLLFTTTSYNASGGVLNQVEDLYNGLGQLATEYQSVSGAVNTSTTPSVQYGYNVSDGAVLNSMTYPNGRVVDYNYNTSTGSAPGVISSLSDSSGNIQSYGYQGLDMPMQATDGNGVVSTTTLDNFGRTSSLVYTNSSGGTIDGYSYGYDADSNVSYKQNLVLTGSSEVYSYDNLNRLTNYSTGTMNSSHGIASPTKSEGWNLDALGNWHSNSVTNSSGGTTTLNRLNNAQNQIASMNTSSGSGSVNLTYDADGNLTTDQTGQTYVYDAWNRVVSITAPGGDTVTYTYNALGERITETDGNTGVSTDLYYSNQKQVIEEQQSGTITAQYVWGPFYVNQLVQETTSSGTYYAEQDADWNVTSISNSSGAVVERYSYTPYGNVTVLNADGSVRGDGTMASSSVGQEVLGQGMRYSASTGTVDYHARIYILSLGRFGQQDPDRTINGANQQQYEMSNPVTMIDPCGTQSFFGIDPPTAQYYAQQAASQYAPTVPAPTPAAPSASALPPTSTVPTVATAPSPTAQTPQGTRPFVHQAPQVVNQQVQTQQAQKQQQPQPAPSTKTESGVLAKNRNGPEMWGKIIIKVDKPAEYCLLGVANITGEIFITIPAVPTAVLQAGDHLTGNHLFGGTDLEHHTLWGVMQGGFNNAWKSLWNEKPE